MRTRGPTDPCNPGEEVEEEEEGGEEATVFKTPREHRRREKASFQFQLEVGTPTGLRCLMANREQDGLKDVQPPVAPTEAEHGH